jgi:outer membrane protein assembly factor BamA
MTNRRWAGLAAVALALAASADAAPAPSYVLNGYTFGGLKGVNTAELQAKLKDKPGAHITRADIEVDQSILAKELVARHIDGQLFTGIAEKNGRIWVIFQVEHPGTILQKLDKRNRRLDAENFQGATRVSPGVLAAATGLKKGDPISPDTVNAARHAILAQYAKVMPGKTVTLKGKIRTKPDGAVTLTWVITEPK